MKVKVNQKKCIGCGSCVYAMQENFIFNGEGKAECITPDSIDLNEIEMVKNNCPAQAIEIVK